MTSIFRSVSNYQAPFAPINTVAEESLSCRKLDLYRAIVTVGNPSFFSWHDIRQYGFFRALYDSILEKIALVSTNIEFHPLGLRRHPIFESYVTDKKRLVSYNLGMAFAKFYSEKLLHIENLVHLEFLKKQGVVTFVPQAGGARPREPDLVGQTADGKWHLFEAKGVSTSATSAQNKISDAKDQVQQVATINGIAPSTGSACATYIGSDRIVTYLEDPPSDDGKQLEFDKEKFLEAYYTPFLFADTVLQQPPRRERLDGIDFEFYDLERSNQKLSIGLDSEVAELVRQKNFGLSPSARDRLRTYSLIDRQQDRYSVGLDGFVISYTDH